MKKGLQQILLTIAIILATVSPAYAAGERSLSLLSIYFIQGKGVVFTFTEQGRFKASELSGYTWIDGQKFLLSCRYNAHGDVKCTAQPLSCNDNNPGDEKCTTPQSLFRYVGQLATGSVAGFPFSGIIRDLPNPRYCPKVWEKSGNGWVATTGLCNTRQPVNGDWILLDDGSLAYYNENGPAGPGFYKEVVAP